MPPLGRFGVLRVYAARVGVPAGDRKGGVTVATYIKNMDRQELEVLQRDLNRLFRELGLKDFEPLAQDGKPGPATRQRIRDAKFYTGHKAHRSPRVGRYFRWRIEHPYYLRKGHRAGDLARRARGKRRRIAHRHAIAAENQWGGCRKVTNEIIRHVERRRPGTRITSRKRSETFGNPSSDHYVGNTDADAVDFARVNDQTLMDGVAADLGGPSDVADFQAFTITRRVRLRRKAFRVQLIAVTHGTGPHFHAGVKVVG